MSCSCLQTVWTFWSLAVLDSSKSPVPKVLFVLPLLSLVCCCFCCLFVCFFVCLSWFSTCYHVFPSAVSPQCGSCRSYLLCNNTDVRSGHHPYWTHNRQTSKINTSYCRVCGAWQSQNFSFHRPPSLTHTRAEETSIFYHNWTGDSWGWISVHRPCRVYHITVCIVCCSRLDHGAVAFMNLIGPLKVSKCIWDL